MANRSVDTATYVHGIINESIRGEKKHRICITRLQSADTVRFSCSNNLRNAEEESSIHGEERARVTGGKESAIKTYLIYYFPSCMRL